MLKMEKKRFWLYVVKTAIRSFHAQKNFLLHSGEGKIIQY